MIDLDVNSMYPYVMKVLDLPPETWETYLRRLGNGLNGVTERSKTVTESDIVANAQKYMQIKYPGKYIVEQFYNAKKGKFDLRLKFENPKEELMWKLRWVDGNQT